MLQCIAGISLSHEEALVFFSLPGEYESSGDEAESSNADFLPEIASSKSSHKSDDVDVQPGSKQKRRPRKKKSKCKRPAETSGMKIPTSLQKRKTSLIGGVFWIHSTTLEAPRYGIYHIFSKAQTNAAEAFDLYFICDLLEVILEPKNCKGAQKYGHKWTVLGMEELRAYLGMLLLMSVSPRHHPYPTEAVAARSIALKYYK